MVAAVAELDQEGGQNGQQTFSVLDHGLCEAEHGVCNCRKLYTALALLAALSQCFNEELGSSLSGQEYNQLVTVTGDSVLVSRDICTVELSSDLIALLVGTSTRFQNLESIPCRFQNKCIVCRYLL